MMRHCSDHGRRSQIMALAAMVWAALAAQTQACKNRGYNGINH